MNNDDPFRINAKPEPLEKKEKKMFEFFEGLKKNSETIKELGTIAGWVVGAGVVLSVCAFGIHSCSSEEFIRSQIIDCIHICDGHENVESFNVEGPNDCRCRAVTSTQRAGGQ